MNKSKDKRERKIVWNVYKRISREQIMQYHLAQRPISEYELENIPDKWWVSEQLVDFNNFEKSILKQYKLRGNL